MNCAISVVIIGWDGYFFHDEIVADRYLSLRQAERWMCLLHNETDISNVEVHSHITVERIRNVVMNARHFSC